MSRSGRSISRDKKLQMLRQIRHAARELIRLNGGKDIELAIAIDERPEEEKHEEKE